MLEREELIELLSRYFQIGDSYAYNLTRVKTAFEVGTMSLDDFEEFDENTVADIADYLIEHSEPVQDRKYRHAVLVLQAIAQRNDRDRNSWNDYGMASAFCDCREAAERCLKYLGEDTKMPNREKRSNLIGKPPQSPRSGANASDGYKLPQPRKRRSEGAGTSHRRII